MEKPNFEDFIKKEGTSLAAAEKFLRIYFDETFGDREGGWLTAKDVELLCMSVVRAGYKFGQANIKEHGGDTQGNGSRRSL